MARFLKYEPCPKCRARGRDRRGDNLGRYSDGSGHCFSCGNHEFPSALTRASGTLLNVNARKQEEGPLPFDFTREVPAAGWKWLLQFGLPYSYWRPFTGYSPASERLVLTHGNPIEVSVGRFLGSGRGRDAGHSGEPPRKWRQWGDKLNSATTIGPVGETATTEVVLVEDLISAHKVGQVATCLPLFGTALYPKAIRALRALKRPVVLWLDEDQYEVLPPKINRLQTFLNVPVWFVKTEKDPKAYSLDEIKEILK